MKATAAPDAPPRPTSPASVRAKRLLVILVIGGAFALNAAATWRCWGDLIIDTGRELDTPKQLAEGKMLYRDVRYWYGPLAPYLHAMLYHLFGVRVDVLTTAGLTLAGLLAWLSYRLLRLFVDRAAATVGTAGLLTINAFGFYRNVNIFNFVLPYSYPAVYGITLGLAGVYFLIRHLRNGRASDFGIACGLVGLVALCKLETLAAALAAYAMFVLIVIRQPRLRPPVYVIGYAAATAVPIAVFSYFRVRAGPGLWRDNLFLPGNVNVSDFILRHSGLLNPAASLRNVGWSLVVLFLCIGIGVTAQRLERRVALLPAPDESDDQTSDSTSVANAPDGAHLLRVLIVLSAVIFVVGIVYFMFAPATALTGLPVILLIALVVAFARWWRNPSPSASEGGVLVLLTLALAAPLRMGLDVSASHYGFYLTVPAWIAMTIVVCSLAPRFFDRGSSRSSRAALASGLSLLLAFAAAHALNRHLGFALRYSQSGAHTIHGNRGTIVPGDRYVGAVDAAVKFLQRQPAGTRVVVVPEGCAITFLAGCENPLGVHSFLPLDFTGDYDEAHMIERLDAAPPDFILVTSRNTSEYGARAFGEDYARALAKWIMDHYRIVDTFRSPSFAVCVMKHAAW